MGELIAVLVVVGIIGLIVWIVRNREDPYEPPPLPPSPPPVSTNYGSAKWAPFHRVPNSLTDLRGVFFGKSFPDGVGSNTPGAPVCSTPETHTLIVARTRAGKGTRVIIPTLLRYDHSMIVIDPKGENAAVTARSRHKPEHFRTAHIVNPWGVLNAHYKNLGFSSATFNPLDAIDRNDPNAVAIAQSLAATMCPVTDAKNGYWQGSAANVLTGVLLWIKDRPDQKKTLARAREIVTQSRADFKKDLARMVTSTAFDGAIKEMLSQYLDLADETYSGIMSNLAESTKFISDPQIKASTASSSFSMKTLRDEVTTVYLVIPHDRIQTHATWLKLIISAAMEALKSRDSATEPLYRCMFLIDEFGSIGNIPDIPRDIALMSGYGVDFTFVIQGLDQLQAHYGTAGKGTILNNCAYKWFCNISDLETAKYLSESLGKRTVQTKSTSYSKGESTREDTATASGGESTSYAELGRALLTPDEILNLGRESAILLNPHGAPHWLSPIDYWNLQETFAALKDRLPQWYWSPYFFYDENPYCQDWQEKEPPRITEKEARKALAVSDTATAEEIRAAFASRSKGIPYDYVGHIIAAKELLLKKIPPPDNTPQFNFQMMTFKDARMILGVGEKATPAEIEAAYTRCIQKLPPGINYPYCAAQLNAAKEVLLSK